MAHLALRAGTAGGTHLAKLVIDMHALSAFACVERLRELGFTIGTTGVGMTLLRKGERRVIVPHVTLEPPMLVAILRSAGVTETEFFRSVKRSGVYAKTPAPIPNGRERKTGE